MKPFLVASMLLLGLASTAQAACTIPSLNGVWTMNYSLIVGSSSTMNSGKWQFIFDANNSFSVYVTSMSAATCKGSGYFILESGGTTTIRNATFVMEHSVNSASDKANFLYMTADLAPPASYMFHLQRE